MSFISTGSLSPTTSQYVTCNSVQLSDSPEKVIPGTVNYSSLPLPKEDCFKLISQRQNKISRHLSEPCIHDCIKHHQSPSKCNSCPQRRGSSSKYRSNKKGMAENCSMEQHLPEAVNRSSIGEVLTGVDDVEGLETQWHFIRTLIDELNNCRSQTNRMTVELHQAKMEIQMLKATLESYTEAGIQPGIIAGWLLAQFPGLWIDSNFFKKIHSNFDFYNFKTNFS